MGSAGALDVRGGGQGLDLPGGGTGVGGVDKGGMQEVFRGPFDKRFRVTGDRRRGRVVHMSEDGVEHRPGMPGQLEHELPELAVEVAEEEQGLLAQHREAGVMHRADGRCPEHVGHERRQFLRQRSGIRG